MNLVVVKIIICDWGQTVNQVKKERNSVAQKEYNSRQDRVGKVIDEINLAILTNGICTNQMS